MIKEESKTAFKKAIGIVDILLIVIMGFFIVLCLINYSYLKTIISTEVLGFGLVGLFIFTFIIEFIPQILNPYIGLVIAIVAGFNVHLAVFIVCIASTGGSWAGFEFGRHYGFRIIKNMVNEQKLKKVISFWNKYGNLFVLFSVITTLPYLPMVFGSLKMTRRNFLLFGVIPRILDLAIIGYAAHFGFSWPF
ncbi:MAG: hypothetical protein AABX17_03635 [Nanoarchaeota archaeon]